MQNTASLQGNLIELSFDFNLDILEVVRDITGREWDKKRKTVWTLPATPWHAHEVIKRLPMFKIDPEVKKLAKGERKPPRLEFPAGLYAFQETGVEALARNGGRMVIADDMGLGKTIEALAYIKMFGGKTLIITPANVLYKWQDEYKKWIPGCTVAIVRAGNEPIPDADAVIMSYAIMTAQYERLIHIPFDVGIWDEAHYLKSPKAQRTRVAKAIINSGLPKVLFLSGTPFMNEPSELFTLLNMLDPVGFNNYWTYAKKYCGAMQMDGHWLIPKHTVTNVDELADRLKHYMIRRTKRDVELELPDLTRSYLPVDIPNYRDYLHAVEDVSNWLNHKGKEVKNKSHVLTRLNVLRQVIGEGKVDAAAELAESILDAGRKVVLFAHHHDVVRALCRKLMGKGVAVIDGNTPADDRLQISKLFLSSLSSTKVIIMSVAGAEGIDLYSASDVIFVEREWTPAKEEQAEARLHRIGQKNPVNAWYLVARDTVDEKINELVQEKRKVFGQVIHTDTIVELVIEELLK